MKIHSNDNYKQLVYISGEGICIGSISCLDGMEVKNGEKNITRKQNNGWEHTAYISYT